MKKIIITTFTLFIIACMNIAQAQSLDDVLKKHFKAVGQDKIANATSFSIKAKVSQMGMELPMDIKIKKPNMFRLDIEMQGQKMVQAYDGENGWMLAPWLSPDPQVLAGDDLKQAMQQANIEGELYNYKKKGHSADLIGKVNVDGKEAYKIKLTTKDGSIQNYFIDADSYLVTKVKAKITSAEQTIEVEQKMLDFKTTDGVTMAMRIESISPIGTSIVIMEEVKLNEVFDDAIFKKPAK